MSTINPKNAETKQYLGEFPNVSAVREFDRHFLKQVEGSFEAIADRMKVFLEGEESGNSDKYNRDIYTVSFNPEIQEKGMHPCIFEDCDEWETGLTFSVKNEKTERSMYLNSLIEHMAREHHFLEKVRDFGITAQEFYEHFMQDN